MNKGTGLLILGLVVGAAIGFFYHNYKYDLLLEAGSNWEAGQYLDTIVYDDVTNRVEIVCLKGNKNTFQAKDVELGGRLFGLQEKMGLYFTDQDFDENGKYNGTKNFLLQRVCEIPEQTDEEIDEWIEKSTNGEDVVPDPYFEVKLKESSEVSSLGGCLNQLNDPIGIGESDTEKEARRECFEKFPPEDPNNPLGI